MKQSTTRKWMPWVAVAALGLAATGVIANPPGPRSGAAGYDCPYQQGQGGPGMMGGGQGPGMMGGGYGPGMMGGQGPGMMMGGGYGPGMMGGQGPGMMMGGGYGPGMMGGYGPDFTPEQRKEANAIMDQTRKSHWSMMGAMMDEQAKLRDLYAAEKPDRDAIGASYKRIGEIRQSMYESMIDAHQKMDALLTDEQRAQMYRGGR